MRPSLVPLAPLLALALVAACGGSGAREAVAPAPAGSPAVSSATASAAPSPAPAPAPAPAPSTPSAPAPSASASASAPSPVASATPSGPRPRPAKISARHILVQWMGCQQAAPSVVRTRDQARVVAEEVERRAKRGEDFARLAVEFSDEPNAGARGGSLGRFGHGAMVKEFEDAAFALAPGEISGIVESPFGFHVIQRTE
ncbi:MAG TPA: peptidylprolyl isomerase [Polyangiaceae bacterium]